ncbi:MAG: hypothetical protein JNK11_07875 [Alphaproteobacteria bacterium]|nr:hypothetical protein [Alphaproteobacteria bacterium]
MVERIPPAQPLIAPLQAPVLQQPLERPDRAQNSGPAALQPGAPSIRPQDRSPADRSVSGDRNAETARDRSAGTRPQPVVSRPLNQPLILNQEAPTPAEIATEPATVQPAPRPSTAEAPSSATPTPLTGNVQAAAIASDALPRRPEQGPPSDRSVPAPTAEVGIPTAAETADPVTPARRQETPAELRDDSLEQAALAEERAPAPQPATTEDVVVRDARTTPSLVEAPLLGTTGDRGSALPPRPADAAVPQGPATPAGADADIGAGLVAAVAESLPVSAPGVPPIAQAGAPGSLASTGSIVALAAESEATPAFEPPAAVPGAVDSPAPPTTDGGPIVAGAVAAGGAALTAANRADFVPSADPAETVALQSGPASEATAALPDPRAQLFTPAADPQETAVPPREPVQTGAPRGAAVEAGRPLQLAQPSINPQERDAGVPSEATPRGAEAPDAILPQGGPPIGQGAPLATVDSGALDAERKPDVSERAQVIVGPDFGGGAQVANQATAEPRLQTPDVEQPGQIQSTFAGALLTNEGIASASPFRVVANDPVEIVTRDQLVEIARELSFDDVGPRAAPPIQEIVNANPTADPAENFAPEDLLVALAPAQGNQADGTPVAAPRPQSDIAETSSPTRVNPAADAQRQPEATLRPDQQAQALGAADADRGAEAPAVRSESLVSDPANRPGSASLVRPTEETIDPAASDVVSAAAPAGVGLNGGRSSAGEALTEGPSTAPRPVDITPPGVVDVQTQLRREIQVDRAREAALSAAGVVSAGNPIATDIGYDGEIVVIDSKEAARQVISEGPAGPGGPAATPAQFTQLRETLRAITFTGPVRGSTVDQFV